MAFKLELEVGSGIGNTDDGHECPRFNFSLKLNYHFKSLQATNGFEECSEKLSHKRIYLC